MTSTSYVDDNEARMAGCPVDSPLDSTMEVRPSSDAPQPGNEVLAPTVGDLLPAALLRMQRRRDCHEQPLPLPWPSFELALGGGLWPGLHYLVGNSATGKTQLALQIALHAARSGAPVLYVGLELDRESIVARLLGAISERPWSSLLLGKEDVPEDAVEELGELPIHLLCAPPYGWGWLNLEPTARAFRAHHEAVVGPVGTPRLPWLMVLDYIQLIGTTEERAEDIRTRVQQAAYALRAIARDLDCAVLALSSVAREKYGQLVNHSVTGTSTRPPKQGQRRASGFVHGTSDPTELMGFGKESGETEYSADTVMVLARDAWGAVRPEWTTIHLAIAKQRAGTPGWVPLRFNGTRFERRDFHEAMDSHIATTQHDDEPGGGLL